MKNNFTIIEFALLYEASHMNNFKNINFITQGFRLRAENPDQLDYNGLSLTFF